MRLGRGTQPQSLIFLALIFMLCWNPMAHAQPKKIVVIRYRIEPTHFATVLDAFRSTMAQKGYIEGRDIHYVDVLTRSADKDSLPDVIRAVHQHKNSADMFITCGWVSLYARDMLKGSKVPQLFVPVLRSVALEMLPSVTEPPHTNLSGLYLMYPPEKIVRLAKLIIPEIRNYAYVYDSRIPADMVFKTAYEQLRNKHLYDIDIHFLDLAEGIEKTTMALQANNIEAFGGIVGAFKHQEALAKSNIPVITSFPLDIDEKSIKDFIKSNTVVAGLFNSFRYCGEQAAHMTADIFSGKTTIEQTVPRPARQTAFISLRNARELKLPISFDALEAVDIVIQ